LQCGAQPMSLGRTRVGLAYHRGVGTLCGSLLHATSAADISSVWTETPIGTGITPGCGRRRTFRVRSGSRHRRVPA
jgi:hypothetical protein